MQKQMCSRVTHLHSGLGSLILLVTNRGPPSRSLQEWGCQQCESAVLITAELSEGADKAPTQH